MAARPLVTCPRCQRPFEEGRGKGVDGLYCSIGCAKSERMRLNALAGWAARTPARREAAIAAAGLAMVLPAVPPPSLPGAFCASGVLPPNWWTSRRADETEAACHACRTRCPVITQCREYGLSLAPTIYPGVLGGMTGNERIRALALAERRPGGRRQRQAASQEVA